MPFPGETQVEVFENDHYLLANDKAQYSTGTYSMSSLAHALDINNHGSSPVDSGMLCLCCANVNLLHRLTPVCKSHPMAIYLRALQPRVIIQRQRR